MCYTSNACSTLSPTVLNNNHSCNYRHRQAHKRLCMVLPLYSKIQGPPGITSCRLMKDNKQQVELTYLLMNDMPKDAMDE